MILGQEAVTQTGHWRALGIGLGQVAGWRYGVRHDVIARHVGQARAAGGLCVAAHPHAPYAGGVFMYPFEGFDAVEVWNGLWSSDLPWNADNNAAVAEWGRSLAASGQSCRPVQASPGTAGQPDIGGRTERQRQSISRRDYACVFGSVHFHSEHRSRSVTRSLAVAVSRDLVARLAAACYRTVVVYMAGYYARAGANLAGESSRVQSGTTC